MTPDLEADLARAARLEWWTIAWMASIIAVMGLVTGSSQAMRTAWIEDMLSVVPALVFLIARRLERLPPSARFPFGFQRAHSLAFLISAVALFSVGAVLLIESAMALLAAERVTVEPVRLFGQDVWLGWMMIVALAYSVIPPVILGRLKLPLARRLQDKVLFTDAQMQKADWLTGLAGIAGVFGIALGWWWADAVAAGFIAVSIVRDGYRALCSATAELIDGAPRALGSDEVALDALALHRMLEARFPGAEVRLRETGRLIQAQVEGGTPPEQPIDVPALWPGETARAWRLDRISFVHPPRRD